MIAHIYLAALGAVFFPSSVTVNARCTISKSQIKAYYGPGDGLWRIQLAWSSENPDCKVNLKEQVDGKKEYQLVDFKECTKGKYCYFNTSEQCCSNDKMQYKSMKFSTECSCHFATFTFTIKDLLPRNSSHNCESIIPPGKTSPVKVDNMEFRECGKPCHIVNISRECPAVGCYCKDGYMLNTTTGKCFKRVCPPDKPPECTNLTLVTHECVKAGGFLSISWKVNNEWNYTYTISSSDGIKLNGTVSGQGDSRNRFQVEGRRGTLTVHTEAAGLRPNNYTIEVVTLTSTKNCSDNGSFSIQKGCLPSIPIILSVPECNRFSSRVIISWNAQNNREYKYSITEFISSKEVLNGSLTGKGIVTIPGRVLKVGNYSITVEDLSTKIKSMNSTIFEIKAGCKPNISLDIDGKGMCLQRFSYLLISWKVEEDRTYKYSISKEGTVVEDHSKVEVPGSGSASFPVSNGRGQVNLTLEPGDYTVTVQDLDAGVKNYYTESEDFSVKACNFEIETSNCVEKGQNVTVSLLAFPDRTYEFSVLVENTSQAVLNGSFLSGVSQNGVMARYDLNSSDSLPVGRYSVLIREVETGGGGYGRFGINSYGNISADVKYRADPLPDALYVCLDPKEGWLFSSGLTYKINDGIESSLQGLGMCLEEAYGGGQGTLEITIKKDGTIAGTVDIDYDG